MADCEVSPWWEELSLIYRRFHGYFGFATCIVGFLANLMIVSVLVQKHMRTSTNILLLSIAAGACLMMAVCAPTYLHFYITRHSVKQNFCSLDLRWTYYFIFYSSFTIVCHTAGIWLTVALAFFRLLHITLQVKTARTIKSNKTAKLVSAAIYLFSLVLTVPNMLVNGYSSSLEEHDNVTDVEYCINSSEFAMNHNQVSIINFWVSGVCMRLLPTVLMIILTALLLHQLRLASTRRKFVLHRLYTIPKAEARRKQETRTTTMLVCVVFTFLVVELPQGALSLLNHLNSCFYENIYQKLGDLIDALTLIKNLINFVLLTTMSKQFRATFVSQVSFVVLSPFKCASGMSTKMRSIQTTQTLAKQDVTDPGGASG